MIDEETVRPLKNLLINLRYKLKIKNRQSVEFLLENYRVEKVSFILEKQARTKEKPGIEKLAYFYLRCGEIKKARQLLEDNDILNSPVNIQVGILEDRSVTEIIDRQVDQNKNISRKAAQILAKNVKDYEEKEKIKEIVLATSSIDKEHSIWRLRAVGEASRRAGDYKDALQAYRRAFSLVCPKNINTISEANQKPGLLNINQKNEFNPDKAWRALQDFKSLASPGWFIDAGTLLGFVREGTFLKHDYDLDIGFIDFDYFLETKRKLFFSPLFEIYPGRVEEVFQVKHANNMDIDVILYKREQGKMVKESHVYRWVFDLFNLSERKIGDVSIPIPSNPEKHLEAIYGDWWVPRKDFDGRYDAYNVSFPNLDELECVLLNRAILALQKRDYSAVRKEIKVLKRFNRVPSVFDRNL